MSEANRGASGAADLASIMRLLKDTEGNGPKGLPPIHKWNPPFCGDLDMVIKRNGQWFHEGTPIGRAPLVRLFSTILRREDDDDYYLVTPVEKVRIRVEDAPFLVTQVECLEEGGQTYLRFTTQTGDQVIASADHPLWVTYRQDEPSPYVHIRDRLHALIGRTVYYQLVDWGRLEPRDGDSVMVVESAGQQFEIGRLPAEG